MTTHLYIATPAYSCALQADFAQSLFSLQGACIQRRIACTIDMIGNESLVQRARNILTARFLKNESATHLLFIDADIAFNPDSVFRLLEHDKPVISGVYAKKAVNWDHVRRRIGDAKKDLTSQQVLDMGLDFNINLTPGKQASIQQGVVEVLDTATGFLLIKRHVIEDMYQRYRNTLLCRNDIPSSGQQIPEYVALFDCMIDKTTRRYLSEDYAFSRRYQDMGGQIFADLSIPLSHIGTHQFIGAYPYSSKERPDPVCSAADEGH